MITISINQAIQVDIVREAGVVIEVTQIITATTGKVEVEIVEIVRIGLTVIHTASRSVTFASVKVT